MNAVTVAWGCAIVAILASGLGAPEVGLFLALAAALVLLASPNPERRDARRRNRRGR